MSDTSLHDSTNTPQKSFAKLPIKSRLRQRVQKLRVKLARQPDDLRDAHAGYWGKLAPFEYYDRVSYRFEEWFKGPHAGFVDAVADLTEQQQFDRLIEVGCGEGLVLAELTKRMPRVKSFIGLDINAQIIERNRETYADLPNTRFMHADLAEIAPLCTARNTLFFVYGGVLEYFTESELSEFLRAFAQKDCAIAFAEPIDPGHDLATVLHSYPFGEESSFSHNHRHLLERAGWQITSQEEATFSNIRWQMVIARTS